MADLLQSLDQSKDWSSISLRTLSLSFWLPLNKTMSMCDCHRKTNTHQIIYSLVRPLQLIHSEGDFFLGSGRKFSETKKAYENNVFAPKNCGRGTELGWRRAREGCHPSPPSHDVVCLSIPLWLKKQIAGVAITSLNLVWEIAWTSGRSPSMNSGKMCLNPFVWVLTASFKWPFNWPTTGNLRKLYKHCSSIVCYMPSGIFLLVN